MRPTYCYEYEARAQLIKFLEKSLFKGTYKDIAAAIGSVYLE